MSKYIPEALTQSNIAPYPYQWEGVKALATRKRFLLRDEPGLGKTIQCIIGATVAGYNKEFEILVVTTVSMVQTWKREIMKWAMNGNYTVINHDKLACAGSEKYICKKWDIIIADEAHLYLRNRETIRAKAFLMMLQNDPIVWMSTATPANSTAEDYFLAFKILMPDVFKKVTKTAFISKYCKKVEQKFYAKSPVRGCKCRKLETGQYECIAYKFTGFNNTESLGKILDACSIRRTAEEVNLQLPSLTITDRYLDNKIVKFTPEEVQDIRDKVYEGIALGEKYHDRLKDCALNKVPSILDMLQTYPANTKIVVFAWHRDVVTKLESAIAKHRSVEVIMGGTAEKDRQDIMDRFQNGDLNTLVLNMKSGGVGITLTAATVGIYTQFPTSADVWEQSMKRIYRIGSKQPVQIIKLIDAGSIDEQIWEVLEERLTKLKEIEG